MDFQQYVKEEGMMLFFGVSHNQFKLNDKVFEAIEDEADGYRSYLGSIEVRDPDGIFFGIPLGVVRLDEVEHADGRDDFEGYQLVDVFTGHVWLTFGTENSSDYYPWFIFDYTPDKNQRI